MLGRAKQLSGTGDIVVPGPFAIRSPHLTLSGAGALFSVVM